MLLNAVKDVASSLINLLDSAKNSSGRPVDGAGDDLKNATKVYVLMMGFMVYLKDGVRVYLIDGLRVYRNDGLMVYFKDRVRVYS